MSLHFNYEYTLQFLTQNELNEIISRAKHAHHLLHDRSGEGNQFLGWLDVPNETTELELQSIQSAAEKIKQSSDVLLVIGVGGSYLGAKAVIDLLNHSFYNLLSAEKRAAPEIFFVGHTLSSTYISHLMDVIEGKDIFINVISKSGTTLEPALAFRFFREYLERKYGIEGARKRIYVTTDKEDGELKRLAIDQGYTSFVIPDDIGGRYSVLTAVGLLPLAVSGINIEQLLLGAKSASMLYANENIEQNPCYQYAIVRNALYKKGKTIELFVGLEPQWRFFAEWWRQLFGESEGKDGKGIFPAYIEYTTDLHSLGQYLQDGERNLFETVVVVDKPAQDIFVNEIHDQQDSLRYLAGTSIDYINKQSCIGTIQAHTEGGVPTMQISIPQLDAYHVGELIYFFEKACAMSGYILGVNPFNQPGVEAYKQKMYALLKSNGDAQERT